MNYVTVNRFLYQDAKQTDAKIALFPGVCTIYSNLSMVCTTPHAPPPPPLGGGGGTEAHSFSRGLEIGLSMFVFWIKHLNKRRGKKRKEKRIMAYILSSLVVLCSHFRIKNEFRYVRNTFLKEKK